MQATSKGSDQTARMRRLVLAFVGRTYHIVGNLMSGVILHLLWVPFLEALYIPDPTYYKKKIIKMQISCCRGDT